MWKHSMSSIYDLGLGMESFIVSRYSVQHPRRLAARQLVSTPPPILKIAVHVAEPWDSL